MCTRWHVHTKCQLLSVVALCKAYLGPGPGSILLDNAIGVQNIRDVGVEVWR